MRAVQIPGAYAGIDLNNFDAKTKTLKEAVEEVRMWTRVFQPHGAGITNLWFCGSVGTGFIDCFVDTFCLTAYFKSTVCDSLATGWRINELSSTIKIKLAIVESPTNRQWSGQIVAIRLPSGFFCSEFLHNSRRALAATFTRDGA